ncbi:uroporphyrinogen-III C-methyltransferase [Providencia heimbachae]|uniref:siroheme synthase CysG n=1 Tax=Providencia heimbachae TaxID=333962 RepID=UPI0010BEC012|nr:siroheme synthase CysG [Providencia heimbachae]QCJ69196.1 uroporphyrinogen-III C-methyltransferase [Providencia heimbachae]
MDYLPLFVDLRSRKVVLIGGGVVAARKAELLIKANAALVVISPSLCSQLEEEYQQNKFIWQQENYQPNHLDDAYLVIAATDDELLNEKVFHDANVRKIFINVVDNQPLCSFIVPSIIDRSPVIVAVSSGGTAPVLARLLREKLETMLPNSLGKMAEIAGRWRAKVKESVCNMRERKRFWEKSFSGRFASLVENGQFSEAEQQLERQLYEKDTNGELILVGAGPGDAGLLTLKGLRVLQSAEVVLYDHLVSDEILELVRRDADKICVGKRAGSHSVSQEETNALIVKYARQGKKVVRLKGGDPFVFGRGGEELQIAAEAGIPFQVVPGVTAAIGAAAYAGIPLTHREHSQSITFITGHCRNEGMELDWQSLARGNQTLAIYMGTVKATNIRQQLIQYGRHQDTPIAVIGCGTRCDQKVLTGKLHELEILAQQAPTPALIIIGEVTALHQQLAWFGPQTEDIRWRSAVLELA